MKDENRRGPSLPVSGHLGHTVEPVIQVGSSPDPIKRTVYLTTTKRKQGGCIYNSFRNEEKVELVVPGQ